MEIIPGKLRKLWNLWELRYLVLVSLFIQTTLICTASIRKHTAKRRLSFLVWSCYLLADWIATLALGVLAETVNNNSAGNDSGNKMDDRLKALWAPFLLLHLGGPDNITAFSLEDNELWLRHLIGLLFQVGTTIYIFIMWLPESTILHLIFVLMFMGGIIKYVERTLALMNASRSYFRKSMVTDPDPGPNYAKFMEEYSSKRDSGVIAKIVCVKEPELPLTMRAPPHPPSASSSQDIEKRNTSTEDDHPIELILRAHHFFQTFKRLIVDLILTFHDRNQSWSFFTEISWDKAYKVIEIELGFLYEVLYTKAAVVHTLKGWIFRFTSVSSIIVASIIFVGFTDKHKYKMIDVRITYVLLAGAIALELWSLTRLLLTDWTIVWMRKKNLNGAVGIAFKLLSLKRPPNRSRWSNSMAQYNLIEFCLKDQMTSFGRKFMELTPLKDFFDNQWYRSYKDISDELKIFIFEALKSNVKKTRDFTYNRHFRTSRGKLALQGINDEVLHKSIKVEFDESILLWHIATDICYHLDGEKQQPKTVSNQKKSRDISNYMLYLLVSRPYMLTAGIGQIRFGDTCAEAKRFFHRREIETSEQNACERLNKVDTEVSAVKVKGDGSKSVLFEASRVAKSLKKVPDVEKRWEIISHVWLEMLCYAASECRGYYHAQRLSAGGELLTVVCFLMAHLGIGEQYRVESGHARAKLIVKM